MHLPLAPLDLHPFRELITDARRHPAGTGHPFDRLADHRRKVEQVCRYLVKDFGTSQSPKSTRQRDSRYCP
ncbi:MAG: hypothetical protein G8D28_07815, partial [gamma proteobacterium symbiont of Phacoides pectinatus]